MPRTRDRRRTGWAVVVPLVLVAVGIYAAGALGSGRRTTLPPVRTVTPPQGAAGLQSGVVNVVHAVSPSVVQIRDSVGLGSGIAFDGKGDIVTNAHVVAGAHRFVVTTRKGRSYQATLVGRFRADDIAVVKVSRGVLQAAEFADSSNLAVGDVAIAIGNPLGLRSSVTLGIVSGFRHGIPEGGGVSLPSVIQTSAQINPGNSGGALVGLDGRVIGIPTLAATDPQLGGSAPGIGFAIPSNTVKQIASQLIAHGHVVASHRAYLGIRIGDTGGHGVYVASVVRGGPADRGGIASGDVIVSVANSSTATVNALSSALSTLKPGRRVAVSIEHQNGKRTTLHVTLGQYPG